MAYINFPQFQVVERPLLRDKGYWYVKTYRPNTLYVSSFAYSPLHRKAALLKLSMYLYLVIALISVQFVSSITTFVRENEAVSVGIWIVPFIVYGIFALTKTYDASRKTHQEVNDDKRDGLYTSDQSLYTTELEGTYICQACSTPVASTNDKMSVEKPYITVTKLLDLDLVESNNGQLFCITCGASVGTTTEEGYRLDGEKLALDADELHLIYP